MCVVSSSLCDRPFLICCINFQYILVLCHQGGFYTNGRHMGVVVPKGVAPNISYVDRPMVRIFDLSTGEFVADYQVWGDASANT